MSLPSRPIVILGGGGHAAVVADLIIALGGTILGYTSSDTRNSFGSSLGIKYLGTDSFLDSIRFDMAALAMGIGGIGDNEPRARLFESMEAKGWTFPTLVHPSAVVAGGVEIGAGACVMARAVIQAGTAIGKNVLINTGAIVDHHCSLGNHVHVGPGSILCGRVRIGVGTHIGSGATVIQARSLGERVFVAAGSLVARDIATGERVKGVPARPY